MSESKEVKESVKEMEQEAIKINETEKKLKDI